MNKPRLLDLFCGAGGCACGYVRAGFEVFGVDNRPQKNYLKSGASGFVQADALEYCREHGREFDAIHASPPCQANVKGMAAVNRALGRDYAHFDMIPETRELLTATGLPCVIENVVGAPLWNPVKLCGSSFNLDVRRHRLFECSFPIMVPPCDHSRQNGDFWTSFRPNGEMRRSKVVQVYGQAAEREKWGPAMGIDWMTGAELSQAIPPAYTEFIGRALLEAVRNRAR